MGNGRPTVKEQEVKGHPATGRRNVMLPNVLNDDGFWGLDSLPEMKSAVEMALKQDYYSPEEINELVYNNANFSQLILGAFKQKFPNNKPANPFFKGNQPLTMGQRGSGAGAAQENPIAPDMFDPQLTTTGKVLDVLAEMASPSDLLAMGLPMTKGPKLIAAASKGIIPRMVARGILSGGGYYVGDQIEIGAEQLQSLYTSYVDGKRDDRLMKQYDEMAALGVPSLNENGEPVFQYEAGTFKDFMMLHTPDEVTKAYGYNSEEAITTSLMIGAIDVVMSVFPGFGVIPDKHILPGSQELIKTAKTKYKIDLPWITQLKRTKFTGLLRSAYEVMSAGFGADQIKNSRVAKALYQERIAWLGKSGELPETAGKEAVDGIMDLFQSRALNAPEGMESWGKLIGLITHGGHEVSSIVENDLWKIIGMMDEKGARVNLTPFLKKFSGDLAETMQRYQGTAKSNVSKEEMRRLFDWIKVVTDGGDLTVPASEAHWLQTTFRGMMRDPDFKNETRNKQLGGWIESLFTELNKTASKLGPETRKMLGDAQRYTRRQAQIFENDLASDIMTLAMNREQNWNKIAESVLDSKDPTTIRRFRQIVASTVKNLKDDGYVNELNKRIAKSNQKSMVMNHAQVKWLRSLGTEDVMNRLREATMETVLWKYGSVEALAKTEAGEEVAARLSQVATASGATTHSVPGIVLNPQGMRDEIFGGPASKGAKEFYQKLYTPRQLEHIRELLDVVSALKPKEKSSMVIRLTQAGAIGAASFGHVSAGVGMVFITPPVFTRMLLSPSGKWLLEGMRTPLLHPRATALYTKIMLFAAEHGGIIKVSSGESEADQEHAQVLKDKQALDLMEEARVLEETKY